MNLWKESTKLLFVLEVIGTIAFAISGALVAVEKKMDLFGVAMLGMTTAVGGGIFRDLLLGVTPPNALRNPIYAIISIVVSLVIFISSIRSLLYSNKRIYDVIMLIMDSIGLGVFTVIGVQAANTLDGGYNVFLAAFVGVITGVGGGIVRDLFAGETPKILIKHFYACASLIGALAYIVLWNYTKNEQGMIVGASVTVVLRIFAAHYRWGLPKAE